jgi:SulP family sulfate permease
MGEGPRTAPNSKADQSATGRMLDLIPLVAGLRAYERSWIRLDVLAALTVWALLVPQALAYGQLAGLDPVVGLYASLGAIVGYALFGGVREMSVGPEATIALLTVSVIGPMSGSDPVRFASLAAALALVTGVLLVLGGLARLGFISRYLSRPLLAGYVAGSAIVMIVSQLDSLLGIKLAAQDDTLAELSETVRRLSEVDPTTLAVGLGTMAVVLIVQRVDRRLPAYLVAVLVAIAASAIFGLADVGVAVVGQIPAGLPPLGLPELQRDDLTNLLGGGVAVAVLVYADSGVTGQVLARRGHYRVDSDREFLALGAANIGAALTAGFPVNGSQSRSFTAADAGARSQLSGLLVAGLTVVTLLVLTPLFAPLPKAALAGVIIVVAAGLLDPREFRRLAQLDRAEVGLALLAMAIVVAVGMLAGVIAVAILSLLIVAQRAAQPQTAVLVRDPATGSFRNADNTPEESIPGLVIYRFDAPLFFANATFFSDDIVALVDGVETPVRRVVVSAEAITSVDSTAESMLRDLITVLRSRGVTLELARPKEPLREFLDRAGLLDEIGRDHIYPRVSDAVDAFLAAERDGSEQHER